MKSGTSEMDPSPAVAERNPRVEPFRRTLARSGLLLERGRTTTLQVNVGLLCNQACKHCHLDAGPDRKELMDDKVMSEVVSYAERCGFETIDITGGAPELHPALISFLEAVSPLCSRLMVRSNFSAMEESGPERFWKHSLSTVSCW